MGRGQFLWDGGAVKQFQGFNSQHPKIAQLKNTKQETFFSSHSLNCHVYVHLYVKKLLQNDSQKFLALLQHLKNKTLKNFNYVNMFHCL